MQLSVAMAIYQERKYIAHALECCNIFCLLMYNLMYYNNVFQIIFSTENHVRTQEGKKTNFTNTVYDALNCLQYS